jgi:hypothetical protein
VQRLRKALGAESETDAISPAVLSFQNTMRRLRMAKAEQRGPVQPGVVLQYRLPDKEKGRKEKVGAAVAIRASRARRAAGL